MDPEQVVIAAHVGVAVGLPTTESYTYHCTPDGYEADPPMAESAVVAPPPRPPHHPSGLGFVDLCCSSRDVIYLENSEDPQDRDNSSDEKSSRCYFCTLWMFIFSFIVAAISLAVVVGYVFDLFQPASEKNQDPHGKTSNTKGDGLQPSANVSPIDEFYDKNRESYYGFLHGFVGTPAPFTVQEKALEWMAFEDVPRKDMDENSVWQRFALVVWYFDQGGPTLWSTFNDDQAAGWINHGAGVHECDWKGVDCNDALEVTGLVLRSGLGITLAGNSLSTELGVLTALGTLDFSGHRLQGSIPDEWASLTNLVSLSLGRNLLGSTIPEWIGDLSHLASLSLNDNDFTGWVPDSLNTLTGLQRLELNGNVNLEAVLDDLANNLTQLEHLRISNTRIRGHIPEAKASRPFFGQALESFQAAGVPLTGTIPSTIGLWSNLETLLLENINEINGTIPTEIGSLTKLRVLDIMFLTNLHGTMPTELGNLRSLVELNLEFSSSTGTLPTEFGQLTNLVTMRLSNNNDINGTVPSEWGQMQSLRHLYIEATSIDSVDAAICNIGLVDFEADCHHSAFEMACPCCTICHHNP